MKKIHLVCNSRLDPVCNAQEFVNTPYSLNFFPHGNGDLAKSVLKIENPAISLSAFYQEGESYVLRLVNNNSGHRATNITLCGRAFAQSFGPYEVKTLQYDGSSLEEKTCWV